MSTIPYRRHDAGIDLRRFAQAAEVDKLSLGDLALRFSLTYARARRLRAELRKTQPALANGATPDAAKEPPCDSLSSDSPSPPPPA